MKTDLDRLHAVVEGRLAGRGVGRTFASCHYLAGVLETCEPGSRIVWIIPRFGWMSHIRPMLDQVLREHDIVAHWRDSVTLVTAAGTVRFVPIQDRQNAEHNMTLSHYEVETYGETDDYS